MEVAYDLIYGTRSSAASNKETPVVEIVLPWEWHGFYAIRNHIYPFWLAIPGLMLKTLQIDSNFLVVNSMYFMHCILWVFGDYYFFHLAKTLGGK